MTRPGTNALIIFAAMTATALALILLPLWRQIGATADGSAYDVAVYRDQLGELDRDLESGLIHSDEAEAARAAEAKAVVEMVVADPGAVETTAETV